MLKAKLVVVGGDAKAAEISLSLPTIIGRGREASLTLPHPLVSRQHCELFEKAGMLHVRDMKSLNGTYVDSQRIEASSLLKPDQLLTIGNVTFRAVYSSKDASVAERNANTSNVIEFDEVSSADSDSKIDGNPGPMGSRPTERGNPGVDKPVDILRTVSASELHRQFSTNSDVLSDFGDDQPANNNSRESIVPDREAEPMAQHSIVAAMNHAGVSEDVRDDASISELRGQLPDADGPQASGVDGLVVDESQAPAQPADFSSIELNEQEQGKVESDESELGSFIRKLPR